MTGYSILWTYENDSIKLFLCLYSLAPVACLNLTIYRRHNNYLNTKSNVLGQESRGIKYLEQNSGSWCLFLMEGWKRQLVFPVAEVVIATCCIAGGQRARSWWLLWAHQFATVITAAGDPFLHPALCKQQLITTKHWSSLVQHQLREPESCLLKAAFCLLADMSIFTEWGSTFAQLEHDSFATLALSGPIFQH